MKILETDFSVKSTLNSSYIIYDTIFLVLLLVLLIVQKKYVTLLFCLFGAILYTVVDYGIFYAWLHTRSVQGANPFWFLLWLSSSYGITNFLVIWLGIKKDKNLKEYALIIIIWWICCPMISAMTPIANGTINIERKVGQYHGFMAAMLVIGYLAVLIYNMFTKKDKLPVLRMLIIGILVQFGWEFSLLVNGIRPFKFEPIMINSLIETNLGIPYIYFIYKGISKYVNDDFSKVNKVKEEKNQTITI